MGSYGIHITPHHITSYYLPWGQTHRHTDKHTHCGQNQFLETRHKLAAGQHMSGLKQLLITFEPILKPKTDSSQ